MGMKQTALLSKETVRVSPGVRFMIIDLFWDALLFMQIRDLRNSNTFS